MLATPRIPSLFLLVLCCTSATLVSHPIVQAAPPAPATVPEGAVAGHVWLDQNCDGRKDASEGDVALAGIVQLVNTGADRILTHGDRAQTYYTDTQGNWKTNQLPVNGFDDQPVVWAIAVGVGSAADLGYRPSPEGGDSILHGPTYASATFQVQDGVTLQIGEIGVCPLVGRILIPYVAKK